MQLFRAGIGETVVQIELGGMPAPAEFLECQHRAGGGALGDRDDLDRGGFEKLPHHPHRLFSRPAVFPHQRGGRLDHGERRGEALRGRVDRAGEHVAVGVAIEDRDDRRSVDHHRPSPESSSK